MSDEQRQLGFIRANLSPRPFEDPYSSCSISLQAKDPPPPGSPCAFGQFHFHVDGGARDFGPCLKTSCPINVHVEVRFPNRGPPLHRNQYSSSGGTHHQQRSRELNSALSFLLVDLSCCCPHLQSVASHPQPHMCICTYASRSKKNANKTPPRPTRRELHLFRKRLRLEKKSDAAYFLASNKTPVIIVSPSARSLTRSSFEQETSRGSPPPFSQDGCLRGKIAPTSPVKSQKVKPTTSPMPRVRETAVTLVWRH